MKKMEVTSPKLKILAKNKKGYSLYLRGREVNRVVFGGVCVRINVKRVKKHTFDPNLRCLLVVSKFIDHLFLSVSLK